eukprot:6557-Heterococcus_DN1.PRE.2
MGSSCISKKQIERYHSCRTLRFLQTDRKPAELCVVDMPELAAAMAANHHGSSCDHATVSSQAADYKAEHDAHFEVIRTAANASLKHYTDHNNPLPSINLPNGVALQVNEMPEDSPQTRRYCDPYDALAARETQTVVECFLYIQKLVFGTAADHQALTDTVRSCNDSKGFKTRAGEEAEHTYMQRPDGVPSAKISDRVWMTHAAQMAALRAILCDGRALFEKNATTGTNDHSSCAAWLSMHARRGKSLAAAIIAFLPHELITRNHKTQRTPMYSIKLADGTVVDRHDPRILCVSAVADCPKAFVNQLSWREGVDIDKMKYETDASKVRAALNDTKLFRLLGEYAMLDKLPKMFGGSTAVWWLIEHTEYTGRGITGSGSAKSSRDTVNSLKWRQAVIKGATYQCLQH